MDDPVPNGCEFLLVQMRADRSEELVEQRFVCQVRAIVPGAIHQSRGIRPPMRMPQSGATAA